MIDTTELVQNIVQALTLDHCTVFKQSALTRSTENSDVWSSPIFDLSQLIAVWESDPDEKMEIGFHSIRVNGPRPTECPVHYHISHVIGFVASGNGKLYHVKDGNEEVTELKPKDIFVFPKGIEHMLESPPGQDCFCVTLEIAPKLDYQRHHTE